MPTDAQADDLFPKKRLAAPPLDHLPLIALISSAPSVAKSSSLTSFKSATGTPICICIARSRVEFDVGTFYYFQPLFDAVTQGLDKPALSRIGSRSDFHTLFK